MRKRRLFCELGPGCYALSVRKECFKRSVENFFGPIRPAREKCDELPYKIYEHKSLIRRKLGNTDMRLQDNKAINLGICAPLVNGIIIKPGETFSFWDAVGNPTRARGFREGLVINSGGPGSGVGGGLCQFTNLLHFLALHSSLEITEHHHHDGADLFPDYGRQVPFGCGTSVMYNYKDYRFKNTGSAVYQLATFVDGTHLCGRLRADRPEEFVYHVVEKNSRFVKVGENYYRRNEIYRTTVDRKTGNLLEEKLIKTSDAQVKYSSEFIDKTLLSES